MPTKLFVLGTVTQRIFLIKLPLTSRTTLSGITPSISLALAPAKAIEIGSVQPFAGTNSSAKISIYSSSKRHLSIIHPKIHFDF
jgi:hypothetical protein